MSHWIHIETYSKHIMSSFECLIKNIQYVEHPIQLLPLTPNLNSNQQKSSLTWCKLIFIDIWILLNNNYVFYSPMESIITILLLGHHSWVIYVLHFFLLNLCKLYFEYSILYYTNQLYIESYSKHIMSSFECLIKNIQYVEHPIQLLPLTPNLNSNQQKSSLTWCKLIFIDIWILLNNNYVFYSPMESIITILLLGHHSWVIYVLHFFLLNLCKFYFEYNILYFTNQLSTSIIPLNFNSHCSMVIHLITKFVLFKLNFSESFRLYITFSL